MSPPLPPPVGNTPQPPAPPLSEAALLDAAQWFARLRDGQASATERQAWQHWLQADTSHQHAWQEIAQFQERLAPLRQTPAASEAALYRPRPSRRRLLGLAALLGITGWSLRPQGTLGRQVAHWRADHRTETGTRTALALADGTQLWLNSATALDSRREGNAQHLHLLSGEILLDTPPGAAVVVSTRDGQLHPQASRFSVQQLPGMASRVSVFSGSVTAQPRTGAATMLTAGTQAWLQPDAVVRDGTASAARDAWSRGLLLADGRTLQEVLQELEQHQHQIITVTPAAAGLRVLGGYPLDDPARTLAMLADVLPITVQRPLPGWIRVDVRQPI